TYTIEGEISTDRPELDKPLIVEKDVTFKGGTISLDYGGILLGANATFEGTDLKFNNFAYMGIFANGHELNLSDSTIQWNGQDPFSIVAGGVKNNPLFSAAEGLEAKIDLRDVTFSNEKGEDLAVYAGNVYNISPEVVGGTAQPIGEAGYEKPVTITVGDINGAKATVYGRGAAYTGSKLGDANGTLAVYDKIYVTNECTTNENVHIIIENPEDITCVDGATGLAGEIYVGARLTVAPVDSTQKTLAAKNLGSISLDTKNSREGKVSVKLTNDGVTGFYPTADMNIPENTILDISDMMYSMIIDRLSGGGKLILGLDQILTITGQVSQTTGVAIEKFFADSYETGGTAIGGYSYIEAANSTENSFYFIPEEGSDMEFIFSEGVWTTSGSSEVEILEKIVSIEAAQEEVRVAVGEATIYDDLTIEWEEQALYCQLGYLPMNLLYNDSGEGIIRSEDEYGYYGYTFSIGEQEYLVGVTESQISFQPSLPEGTHKFTFKIPAEYVTTNEEKQFSFTMIVGDGIGQLPPEKGTGTATVTMSDRTYGEEASLPNVVSDTNDIKDAIFTYSGTKADGSEYGPSLQMPEEAGSYQVEAVLPENENYKEAKATAEFVIRKRELQIQNVIIVDKYYDGTTEAGIISLTITDELSQPVVLSEGSDYQLQAAFTTAEIGNNKEVTVTVTLLNNNY
ncbi:MAG: hypothetical protein IKW28_04705, partial [Lachnospiraceae bacterium]|nr:hypothetical protein [Lachnospiraceae bacterium]